MVALAELRATANPDQIIGAMRAVVAEYEKDLRTVSGMGATAGGGKSTSGGYSYGTQSKDQEEQVRARLKQFDEELAATNVADKGNLGKNKNQYKAVGANLTNQLAGIYGGADKLLALDPTDLGNLKHDIGNITKKYSSTMSGAILRGMNRQLGELSSDPTIQGNLMAQKDLRDRATRMHSQFAQVPQTPAELRAAGLAHNAALMLPQAGTIAGLAGLQEPGGKPFLDLAAKAAQAASIRAEMVGGGAARLDTEQDTMGKGSQQESKKISRLLTEVASIRKGYGEDLQGHTVENTSLVEAQRMAKVDRARLKADSAPPKPEPISSPYNRVLNGRLTGFTPPPPPTPQQVAQDAYTARLVSSGTRGTAAGLNTTNDLQSLGRSQGMTSVQSNLTRAFSLFEQMGVTTKAQFAALGIPLETLTAVSTTLAESMAILNTAEIENATLIRAAKVEALNKQGLRGEGTFFQRMRFGSRNNVANSTSTAIAAEGQTGRQFLGQHATNTLGYAAPGIAIGVGFEELSKSVVEAAAAQVSLAQVKAEFEALGQGQAFQGYSNSIQGIATDTGVAVNEVAELALAFKGVFQSTAQATIALQSAAEGAQALGVPVAQLQEDLTGISQAFDSLRGTGGGSFNTIQNEALHLQDIFGVPAKQTLSGTADISAIANQLGLSPNFTMSMVAATAQRSGFSGTDIGSAFGRILPGFATAGGQVAQYASTLGPAGQPLENAIIGGNEQAAVTDFLTLLPKLTAAASDSLITMLGGNASSRAILIAAGQAVGEGGNFISKANSVAPGNRLQQEFNLQMSTVEGQLKRFGSALSNVGVDILDSSLGTVLADIVAVSRTVVNIFGDINKVTRGLIAEMTEAVAAFLVLKKGVQLLGAFSKIGKGASGSAAGDQLVVGASKSSDILITGMTKAVDILQTGLGRDAVVPLGNNDILPTETAASGLAGSFLNANVGLKTFTSAASVGALALAGFAGFKIGDWLNNYAKSNANNTGFVAQELVGAHTLLALPGQGAANAVDWMTGTHGGPNDTGVPTSAGITAAREYQEQYRVNAALGLKGKAAETTGPHILTSAEMSKMDTIYGPAMATALQNIEKALVGGHPAGKAPNLAIDQEQEQQSSANKMVKNIQGSGWNAGLPGQVSRTQMQTPAQAATILQNTFDTVHGLTGITHQVGMDFTAVQSAYTGGFASFADLKREAENTLRIAQGVYKSANAGQSQADAEAVEADRAQLQALIDAQAQQVSTLAQSLVQQGSTAGAQQAIKIGFAQLSNTGHNANAEQVAASIIQSSQTYIQNAAAMASTAQGAVQATEKGYTFGAAQTQAIIAAYNISTDSITKTLADLASVGLTLQNGQLKVKGQAQSATTQFQATQAQIQAQTGLASAQAFGDPQKLAQEQMLAAQQSMAAGLKDKYASTNPNSLNYQNWQTLEAAIVTADQAKITAGVAVSQAKLGFYGALFSEDPIAAAQQAVKQSQAGAALAKKQGKAAQWANMQQTISAQQGVESALTTQISALGSVQVALANVQGSPLLGAIAQLTTDSKVLNVSMAYLKTQYNSFNAAEKAQVGTFQQFAASQKAANTATVLNDTANMVSTMVSSGMNIIQSQLTLGDITSTQAIAELQAMLPKAKGNVTETYQILTDVRQLMDAAGQNLNFNLPTTLVPSTLYQARLAEATNGSMAMPGQQTNNMTINIVGGSASSVRSAVSSVTKAVYGRSMNVTTPTGLT